MQQFKYAGVPGGKSLKFTSSTMATMTARAPELSWHDITGLFAEWGKGIFPKGDWHPEVVLLAKHVPQSKYKLWRKVQKIVRNKVSVKLGKRASVDDNEMVFYFEKKEDAVLVKMFLTE